MAEDGKDELFKGVTYYIVGNIGSEVTSLLDGHGAKRDAYLSEMISHVIADSPDSDYYSEAKELFELPIVSSDWVILSVRCGKQLQKEIFALEGRLLSGIVACPWELDIEDAVALWGMIVYHGGRCQLTLDKSVTHLITSSLNGAKYERAKTQEDKIKIVTPDWVTTSIAKNEKQDEKIFDPELVEYPKPKPPTPEPEIEQEVDMEIAEAVKPQKDGIGSSVSAQFEPMDTGNVSPLVQQQSKLGSRSNTPRQFLYNDERMEIQRPDTPSAKEALARKISSRIHGKASSEPTTPERPSFPSPVMQRSLSPGSATLGGPMSAAANLRFSPTPLSGIGTNIPRPRAANPLDPSNIRNTLRNITNRTAMPSAAMPFRPTMPGANAKVAPQLRAPPPDYPFPPRCAPPGITTPSTQPLNKVAIGGTVGAAVVNPTTPGVMSSTAPPNVPTQTTPPSSIVVAGQSPSGSVYVGHDPKESVPAELCLLGCIFCIVEYQNILGNDEIAAWKKVIEKHGGQMESSYCHRVTHVLCPNQKSEVFKTALKEGKRVVSAFWLNDCLMQKKMVPPWQALHLPLSFNTEKPGFKQMISVTNFDGEERVRLKQMIDAIGAKYTGFMTHQNSALICKKSGGMKFEKAKEWRIAVVNVQWLSDLVLGNMDALRLPVHVRYLQVGQGREFHMDLNRVTHLMGGWKTPVRIHKETWKKFGPTLMALSNQENNHQQGPNPAKRQKVDIESPLAEINNKPRILFTLYAPAVVTQLQSVVLQLGGMVVTNPRHCTHLVCPSLVRTIKFFVAINTCRYVVTKDWIEDSFKQNGFQDPANYALRDSKAEAAFDVKLAESLKRAQSKPLFQGLTFYITPSVVPPACELVSIIETAGGSVVRKRPSVSQILSCIDEKGEPKFVVITCANDLHLSSDLRARKIPIFNAEFVLTGVLRQEIDYNIYRIKS